MNAMPAPISNLPEEREIVVDSGASVRMLSKGVVMANGEVQPNEEALVYVHDLTVQ